MSHDRCFTVLFTKHIVKKYKTYHDGYLQVSAQHLARLYDENGTELARERLPLRFQSHMVEAEGDSDPVPSYNSVFLHVSAMCIDAVHKRFVFCPARIHMAPYN